MKKIFPISLWLLIASFGFVFQSNAQTSPFDSSNASVFSNDDEFLKADEAFVFDFYQKGNKLNVSFNIKEGYYLYRHQFKFTAQNSRYNEIVLPKGEDHEDEYFGVQEIYRGQLSFDIDLTSTLDDATIKIRYQGCADKGLCYPPKKKVIPLNPIAVNADSADVVAAMASKPAEQVSNKNANETNGVQSEQHKLATSLQNDSLLWVLLAFFAGGLLLSFTPCVFPMYPILTGIIVGQGDKLTTKHAFMLSFSYVQGMAVTYTLLGVVVALAGAQFQAMFQHPALLVVLSVLFIFLSLSMFGVFNLALPSSWQNKLNNISSQQKGGSYFGVLAMGALSALVASPCTTAPLTGALLYISQTGDVLIGASALYALSLGMGLPLLILGSSGGKLLPKAGNWMNIIKNTFGILLLAVPVFLLERFLPAVAIQVLWSILVIGAATYYFLANQNSSKTFFHGVRFAITFVGLFFGAMMLYKAVFPSEVTVAQAQHENTFVHVANTAELASAVKEANDAGKTVMVDLYADWCVACKEFEELTFPEKSVVDALSNSVLIQVDLTDTGSDTSVELMEKFQVFGLPSILFFDLEGNELTQQRVTGFMRAEPFAEHINTIFK